MTRPSSSGKLKRMNDTFNEIELRKLDLNLLLVLSALMRERSVSRAAKRLGLGASAVSMALRRLRDSLGDPILVRSGGTMEPTARALSLWSALEPALGSVDAAIRSVRAFDPATARRDVRLAVPDDLDFMLVPRLLDRLVGAAPGIRLITRPADFRTLRDRLDRGDADLALSATADGLERRHHMRMLHREGFLTLYDRDMLGRVGDLDMETWLSTPHVLRTPSGDLASSLDRVIAPYGTRTVLAGISTFALVPFLVQSQPCLVNVPETAARRLSEAFDLELSALPFASPRFDVALHWHVRTHADPLHAWLRDLVADAMAGLVKD